MCDIAWHGCRCRVGSVGALQLSLAFIRWLKWRLKWVKWGPLRVIAGSFVFCQRLHAVKGVANGGGLCSWAA